MRALSGRFMTLLRPLLCMGVCLVLGMTTACGKSGPPVREPMHLELMFVSSKDMNPNAKGRPSPVAIKIFELKSTTPFEEADYFSLQTEAKAVLGDDLLSTLGSFVIRPGGRKELRKPATPGATALGFIAGYRDLSGATWQALHPLPLPPEEGMFTSPVKIVLHIDLLEADMQIQPQR